MTPAITTLIGSLVSGLVALIVAGFQHNKTAALMEYRLGELEKKMDKHNQLQDRMIIQERDMETVFNRIDELQKEVKDIEHHG